METIFMKGKALLLMFCLLCKFSSAQINSISVSGSVVDKRTLKPIELATIELFHLPDSSLTNVTATNKKGYFSFDGIADGNYYVRASFIGYEKMYSPSFAAIANQHFSIARLELVPNSTTLSNVTVKSGKAQLNTSIDRKVYNVESDIMSHSGTASDILRNIPSLEVDIDGNVSLRGSADVIILINGRPNPMMGRSRAEVLQQLPANSIERIEIITNPSARYRPDGTSGIINIVLKKNVRNGLNGTITANIGNGGRYNSSVVINVHPKYWNFFGSYSFRKDTRPRLYTWDREYYDSSGAVQSTYRQTINSQAHPGTHTSTLGLDYTPNDKNSFGLSANIFYRRLLRKDVGSNRSVDKQGTTTEDFIRLRYDPELETHFNATAYYQHNFGRPDHNIRIEGNLPSELEQENNYHTNLYSSPSTFVSYDNTLINQRTHDIQLAIDYSNRLAKDGKLEAGYDGSYNKAYSDFRNEYFDTAQKVFIKDVLKSNVFNYYEDVHALYLTYQKNFEKFGYQVGLRSEAVFATGKLETLDSLVKNNYFKCYPSFHLSYLFNENSELQLNYSKRINRPDADKLNPFPEYKDPRNLKAGNPGLLPEVIHSIELGYKWQNKIFSFVPSFYYRYKVHGFTSIIVPLNDSLLLNTTQNLSNDQSAGLEVIVSAKTKFLGVNLGGNLFYNRIDATDLGYFQNRSIYAASFNFVTSFVVTKTTLLQVSGNYRSAKLTPQGKTFPNFVLNAGMRQAFFKNKISVSLTGSDLFSALSQRTELFLPSLKQTAITRRDGLILYLGISYRFGVIKKSKEEKLQFDNSL
jgi:outer membrane receptor protein involved in Fe transport